MNEVRLCPPAGTRPRRAEDGDRLLLVAPRPAGALFFVGVVVLVVEVHELVVELIEVLVVLVLIVLVEVVVVLILVEVVVILLVVVEVYSPEFRNGRLRAVESRFGDAGH